MGDNSACKVVGIGTIHIKQYDDAITILKNICHVPRLRCNLLSLGIFDDAGYRLVGHDGVYKISKGSQTVMKGVKLRDLYYLMDSTVTKDETVVILTENEPSQDDNACGEDSYGGHSKDPIAAPNVAAAKKDIADAMEGHGGNKDEEAPMKAHGGSQDALLWDYRLGHVIEKEIQVLKSRGFLGNVSLDKLSF